MMKHCRITAFLSVLAMLGTMPVMGTRAAERADNADNNPAGYSMTEAAASAEHRGLYAALSDAPLAKASEEVTASADLFFLTDSYTEYISLPEGFQQSWQIPLPEDCEEVSYAVSSNSIAVDENGLVTLKGEEVYWIGVGYVTEYTAGTFYVYAYADGKKYTYEINVYDYAQYYAQGVVNDYIAANITDDMTAYEKIESICQFVASYDYSPYHSDMVSMIVSGEGGDCWASTSMVNYMCRQLGMQARTRDASGDPGAGSGHRNIVILADGITYMADAGYAGTAPRTYRVSVCDQLFSYTVLADGTAEITEYYGFDTDVVVPESIDGYTVTSIGTSVFYDSNAYMSEPITSVTLPDTIVSIGDSAFAYCDSIGELYLPASVAEIKKAAFYECGDLTLTIDPENPHLTTQDGILFTKDMSVLLAVYNFKGGTYDVPDGVVYIEDQAFTGMYELTGVTFPDTLQDIGYKAFNRCGLRGCNIVLPESVTGIGCYAFTDSNLSSITILNPECVINNTMENNLNEQEDGRTLGGFGSYDLSPVLVAPAGSTAQAYAEKYAEFSKTYEYITGDGETYTETETGPGYLFAEYSDTERRTLESGTSAAGTEWEFFWSKEHGAAMEISSSGEISEILFDEETDKPQHFKMGNVSRILLTHGTEVIGKNALCNLYSAKSCIVPVSVRSIGSNAFDSDTGTILGAPGSYAQTYAANHSCTFVPLHADEMLFGDVNADGAFNVADAVAMQKYLLKLSALEDASYADHNGDGAADAFDLALLKHALLS